MGTKLTLMNIHLQYLFRLCVLDGLAVKTDPYGMLKRQTQVRFTEFF